MQRDVKVHNGADGVLVRLRGLLDGRCSHSSYRQQRLIILLEIVNVSNPRYTPPDQRFPASLP
jgi:hypothetical protein